MRLYAFLIAALALIAAPAFATDGDALLETIQTHGKALGKYHIHSFILCDSKTTGTNPDTCAEFDLQKNGGPGMPDKLIIQIDAVAGCDAAYTVDINHGSVSGGTEHDLATLNAATTAVSIGDEVTLGRFLNIDLTNLDTCTDFDVTLRSYTKRGAR